MLIDQPNLCRDSKSNKEEMQSHFTKQAMNPNKHTHIIFEHMVMQALCQERCMLDHIGRLTDLFWD